MIHAKPVIPDQYWILREQDRKIGNIEAHDGGYVVSINGEKNLFKDLDILCQNVPVMFDLDMSEDPDVNPCQCHGYSTKSRVYNAMFDVRRQLPLWTDEPRSRSWLAAGWYRVQHHRNWRIMHCPKVIILDRYPFKGPFKTREQAHGS
jgi:hypothetical protein